ncbi:hypothetical protein GCM10008179_05670 [Hansschlegelia plantiphila]|uniref:Uncharacterized protein n=1 Tax=Hansschlegelia plantiphila TaxID=374655 RepID=A0A9W6J098_9HYPH|nr:hypothetical protein GCM10008179_05670 [Hansschlegelia plantiphila]
MGPGSPKTDNALPGAGKSEADAAHPVRLEKRPDAGPDKAGATGGAGDAPGAGDARSKGDRENDHDAGKPAPGAIAPGDLNTENDDGAS